MQNETNSTDSKMTGDAEVFLAAQLLRIRTRIDTGFGIFLLLEWFAALVIASWIAPISWAGGFAELSTSVQIAIVWGAIVAVPSAIFSFWRPGKTATRYTVAICQMLMSSLLIYLTNGRIETHFHVFVSLAFLAFYLDTGILYVAGAVIIADQWLRGTFFPVTVWGPYGQNGNTLLWTEHALWIAFMDFLGVLGVRERLRDLRHDAEVQACLLHSNALLMKRTAALEASETQFRQLAESTEQVLAMTDAATAVTIYASPAYRLLWQISPDIAKTSFLDGIALEHRAWARTIWQGAATGVPGLAEVRLQYSDNWARIRTFPVCDTEGTIYRVALTAENITAEKDRETEQTQAYERERRIASALQNVVLTHEPVPLAGWEIAPFYRPALADEAAVCGDFFDTVALPGGKTALIIGDVSGKGLDAARHTAEAKYALRAYLRDAASPGDALEKLNRYLCDLSSAPANTVGTERFIALSLAIVDGCTGNVAVACGGMEPTLVVNGRNTETRLLEEAGGLPLGILPDAVYNNVSLTLLPGDTLIMVSDGVTEARNPKREILGLSGWEGIVKQSLKTTPDLRAVARITLQAVTNYADGDLGDDACGLWARKG